MTGMAGSVYVGATIWRVEGGRMFGRRRIAKGQARRDEEWRQLVERITAADGQASESDTTRFQSYLGEREGAAPRRPTDDRRSVRVAQQRDGRR